MIREYRNGDIDKLNANTYSQLGSYKDVVDGDIVQKLTLEDNGKVIAIIGMFNYWENNWIGFFLIDKDIKPRNIKELKRTLYKLIEEKKPARLETNSMDCPTINKWMKFMGFECEGTRRKFMYDKDYKMWSII